MSALASLLSSFRQAAVSEREKGTYFEELVVAYLRNEPTYKDLYSHVWTYAEWAKIQGLDGKDAGIDLVAKTAGTDEIHAIQCKFYAPDYSVKKADIDSFFTASGKKPFTHRIIVATTDLWSEHAEAALQDQHTPVTKIDLQALEESQIDWTQFKPKTAPILKPKKELRPHQVDALKLVSAGLATADRGKLIMACGTGKTFTSLKIAEAVAGKGKRVLFLVPSLALLSQTLTEWTQESGIPLHSFAVCSDSDVGKKRKADDDIVQTFTHELRYPATTEPARLAAEMAKRHDTEHMSVVFSTYHSIDVIHQAQDGHGMAAFDLIVCDEAHRTTGATFGDEDESAFVRVHEASYIQSAKRLYMTATPRIYGDSAKATAEKNDITLCSMDNEALYGQQLYVITFSEAVKRGLLVDYKVLVLAVEESHISRSLQALLKDDNNQLRVDDAAKIVGCWKALAKQGVTQDLVGDEAAMKRAVAFCQVIEPGGPKAKIHKVSSKNIAGMFQAVVEAYQAAEEVDAASRIICEAEHVDGSMNASQKEAKLAWLKADTPENTCRVLSNVRCLSEGVDVPALDAVLFLTPRNSQVDVVQSVGRVMRNAPGKKRGYVILPVVIPAGVEAHEALNDNKTYAVVWQVLQALRSHDDRFDAMVNKLELNGPDPTKMEVIAVCGKVEAKQRKTAAASQKKLPKKGDQTIGVPVQTQGGSQAPLPFQIGEIEKAIYAKVVQKCGNRHHWEDWAADIAKIARTHIDRITGILENPSNTKEREAFQAFAGELRDDLNDSITDSEIIEMLAQHLITKPVFDALFAGYSFASQNPISQAMQGVLDVLHEHRLDKEADTLEAFYESVRMRADGIESAAGKQKIVVELYDKFFRNAFPKMTERLGIVYTPVEVVDFILHSVNHLLKTEFDTTLGSKGVHIIDPFVGTGTFITRLLQSGLVQPEELAHKYRHEIHANEIVLLAYYIAAINIEATYHDLAGGAYVPFEGICLTDTFQLYEKEDMISALLEDNSARRKRQKKLDIRVIVGNPPYSVGQASANDDNQNVTYANLDERIKQTYAAQSNVSKVRSLYDSYIRAIRWASDRIKSTGIIAFVTNAGFLDSNSASGLRKCLAEEFSSIHVFHLRGNQRTSGERSRMEGGKIFGGGSRAPIAISFLVKNPTTKVHGQIRYHDIGDYLTREQKLARIADFQSIEGIESVMGWQVVAPDSHGDWLGHRDDGFKAFIAIGDKKDSGLALFSNYSRGLESRRDAWCYNPSNFHLMSNLKLMTSTFNAEVDRFGDLHKVLAQNGRDGLAQSFVTKDSTKISWTPNLLRDVELGKHIELDSNFFIHSMYRPFSKTWLYWEKRLVWSRYHMPTFFPNSVVENRVIVIHGPGEILPFTAFITSMVPDVHLLHGSQCFPLYTYEEPTSSTQPSLFAEGPTHRTRRHAITDEGLAHFQEAYSGEKLTKEDLFYYVYGLLHSPDYRDRYADNLNKELPRIPRVKTAQDFWAFSKAGSALADLHLNYETVEPYPVQVMATGTLSDAAYRVEKMRYGKAKVDGKTVEDKTTLVYNDHITLKGIPLEAYDYVVNGKSALDWVVERQCLKTDKDSGIVNDANAWATETMKNPKYPLELFMRVITVSLETMKIVSGLPALTLKEEGSEA